MTWVYGFIRDFFLETLRVLYESGLFVLLGFFVAGLLHRYLAADRIAAYLGSRSLRSIVNAAVLGAPLPLCSCGVLPAAVELRRKGASREAVASFLVSTPETSAESIALSYGLLGPVFTIARPVSALFSAFAAGVAHLLFGKEEEGAGGEVECACGENPVGEGASGPEEREIEKRDWRSGVRAASRYAFRNLFDELVFWFLLGVLFTGLLGALLPDDFFARYLGRGLLSLIVAIVVGIPLYMCASGSTPVAAAFLAKGLNPGAALVFLLTGPATNAATISVLGRVFGRRFLQIYLASLVLSALVSGLVLNQFYTWSRSDVPAYSEGAAGFLISVAKAVGFLVFLYLAYRSLKRTGLRPGWKELKENTVVTLSPLRRLRFRHIYATWTGRAIVLALGTLYLLTGFYTVAPGEVGLERDFGVVTATNVAPGLHWCFPWPVGKVTRCSVEGMIKIDIGFRSGDSTLDPLDFYRPPGGPETSIDRISEEAIYLTGDENLVDILATVHYRAVSAERYTFAIESGESLVRNTVLWALVREIAYREIDKIYTVDRFDLERKVKGRVNRILEDADLGLRVEGIRLLSTHAPREVHYDFRDVASAKEDRARMIHEAGIYWEGTVNTARGTGAQIVSEAVGARQDRVAQATGAASRFTALQGAAREEMEGTRLRLYLETLEKILPGCRTVIRPDPFAVKDFELWFRTGKGVVLPGLLGEEKGEYSDEP